ncbi:dihydrolipoamide acetyltransferase family protein [Streptomyces sp. 3N207]|uniref:dihydrolipoamide acetyltransferase family protein n=1 Tax=Streptomyces sp. 3N207 TaxID=3457417 RepID=UPI003FD05351
MAEIPLVMPKMSMTMEEGILLVWHKAEGDEIRSGDVVCEVMTDKVDMEVESPVDGTLVRLVAKPEQTVAVGEPIAYLASSADDLLGDLLSGPPAPDGSPLAPEQPAPDQTTPGPTVAPPASTRVPMVPLARRRATELGLDLATLIGTGPGGTIRVTDVETATRPTTHATSAPPSRAVGTSAGTPTAHRRSRTTVARQTSVSAAIPQAVVYRDLELEALVAHRGTSRWTSLIIRAYADALRGSPLNARWTEEGSEVWSDVAVALRVDTERGPLAPVLPDPDQLPVDELDESLGRLADQARSGKVPLQHLTAATTTVYDLGDMGVDAFQELLTPPQVTVLSIGTVAPQVVPAADGVEIRTRCRVGLTVDHRVGDCSDAARLLIAVQRRLDEPSWFGWG